MKRSLVAICSVLLLTALPVHADEGRPHKGKMFERHDTNGDGVISKSEFLAHAEERFSKMDADGNGEISKEEAKEAHKKRKKKFEEWKKNKG